MAKINLKKLSDYTNLDDKFIETCRNALIKYDEFTDRYMNMADMESIQQLPLLEKLKREHGSFIYYFNRHMAKISKYKENGEFLSGERKELKSRCISELVAQGNTQTNADKIVYNYPEFKERLVDIREIKEFMIAVYDSHTYHLNVMTRDIHQSLSILQKDLENNKKTQF